METNETTSDQTFDKIQAKDKLITEARPRREDDESKGQASPARRTRITFEEFLNRAAENFGDHYDYGEITDFALSKKIPIYCKIHKIWTNQDARSHYRRHHGCPECKRLLISGRKELRGKIRSPEELTKEFIEKARKVHSEKYDYSAFEYESARAKGKIICHDHGPFWQTSANHLSGTACPKCAQIEKHSGSLKALSELSGKDYWRCLKRRQAGMQDEVVRQKGYIRNQRKINPFSVAGITYPNFLEACRQLLPVASPASVDRWIKKGMTPELAFMQEASCDGASGIIYKITNLATGKNYIGLTSQPLILRWLGHIEAAKRGDIPTIGGLLSEIRRCGENSFLIEEIDRGVKGKGLEQKERDWIKRLDCRIPNGMNICAGGTSGGSRPTPIMIDGIQFKKTAEAAEYVSKTRQISFAAARWRIRHDKVDCKGLPRRKK